MKSLQTLAELWADLGDVPINDRDELEAGFLHFAAGTPREEIWHWFEQQHPDFSVAQHQGAQSWAYC